MIPIKSKEEIALMREAGQIVAYVLREIEKRIKPGVSGKELDNYAEEIILSKGAQPVFKGHKGFPGSICISINEVIVHGVPSDRKIEEGDIVGVDVGVRYKGYCADGAKTLAIGEVSSQAKRLLACTERALAEGIRKARAGGHLSDISWAIQSFVEKQGFSVIRKFVGHGIGKEIHEEPRIPNFGRPHQGPLLKEGMVFCIEPMVCTGDYEVEIEADGWTARTRDRSLAAHFEHMVVINKGEAEILTRGE
ncbi:MAG: type I methionyl aminopeptidase [Candidatus Omnitrophota bacterium]|nr:MAG: type I methionyl aminopeptidase [Candidatus Omnitrophota bacterium]